jgi:CBS domain-containing protein
MVTDHPTAATDWRVGRAVAVMEAAGTDLLPVIGADGSYIGVVTAGDILDLDERLGPDGKAPA